MARPVTPPSAWNSPQPNQPLLDSPRPPHSAYNLTPDPNSYPDSPTGTDTDHDLDSQLDSALAFLEKRSSSSTPSSLPRPSHAPSSSSSASPAALAHALSRRFSQRNFSRRALLVLALAAVLVVSLAASAVHTADVGEIAAWKGRVGLLRQTGGKWKDRAVEGVKSLYWSANGLGEADEVTGPYEPLNVTKVINFAEPQGTLQEQLKEGVRYVTAMAYGGHANQMISIMKMLYFGKLTNRVGIIPTLIPIHIDGPPVPMSTFYDLPRFWAESRIPAVEMSQMKPIDLASANPHNEMIPCWSVQEATVGFANLEAWSFDLHDIWVQHWPLPPLARGLGGFDLAFDALRVFDFDQWAKLDWLNRVQRDFLPQKPLAEGQTEFKGDKSKNLKDGFDPVGSQVPTDQLMCFDNTLFLGPVMFPELPVTDKPLERSAPGEGLSWMNVGQHLRFNPTVEGHADDYLMRLFDVKSPSKVPPFITVHLRRGDFKDFAGFTALEKYVAGLARVQAALQARLDDPDNWTGPGRRAFKHFGLRADQYAVVATTDERGDSDFVKEVKALGWKVLDHDAFETKEKLGGWWPTMLDATILARGRAFVGTDRSTFSHMAGLRVKYWRGGLTELAT
ncbi:hypothetical protein JCM8097_000073 [Rhodosporidiobolus ruineniae]